MKDYLMIKWRKNDLMRKKLKKNKNVISQSISTSIQTKKEYSLPQKNISIFNNNNNRNKIFLF